MVGAATRAIGVCLRLTQAISRTRTVEDIYTAALDALAEGLGISRASILLFDDDGVMRFKASRGLSDGYRRAVEGHTPWSPDTPDPEPIVVADVRLEPSLAPYLPTIAAEGIAAMAFIPLVSPGRVIGKFMVYHDAPRALTADELQLAGLIAAHVAFAVDRTRAEAEVRRSEERLRFALDAALMGTWDWDLRTNTVVWSENLARIHGLPPGTFDGTFASYEREIHPDDRSKVFASVQRALAEGVPHDVEYRIVAPDGTVRWVEGKGRVEYENGTPVRMSGVCVIVTRRKEAELARLAAAEEASRAKDEFLAVLSHELRTPLNAIMGWAQLLPQDGLPQGRVRQAIEVIGRNARLQAQLIEDILDVSRIITGKMDLERRPVTVEQLVASAVAAVLPAADAKRIVVSQDVRPGLPPLEGDPRRLQQVLGNLLSNAVKFTPAEGSVQVGARADANGVVITIRDSGAGIDPEFLPFVFERFRQADTRTTRHHGGLGLGLAIARHIVEQHGGIIAVHSDGPGAGSTFEVRLPVTASAQRGDHEARETDGPLPRRLHGRRVLVVDDQPDSRELAAMLLEASGAEVLQSETALDALAVLEARTVHLLVADIAMPEMDGCELITRVRKTWHMPAVAVSAYARLQDRRRALAAGFTAYYAKPIDAARFIDLVADVLANGQLDSSAAAADALSPVEAVADSRQPGDADGQSTSDSGLAGDRTHGGALGHVS
jgi:PAS domain S-box-containing protein